MEANILTNSKNYKFYTTIETPIEIQKLKLEIRNPNEITLFSNSIFIKDEYFYRENFISLKRKIKILKKGKYKIQLKFKHGISNFDIFIPSVMFKNNIRGKGCFPRIIESKYWSFDESRMSIPGAIEVYDKNQIGIFAHYSNKIHSATSWDDENVYFTIPSVEWPYSYRGKNRLDQANINDVSFINFEENEIIEQEYLFYINRNKYLNIFYEYIKYCKRFYIRFNNTKNEISNSTFKALLLRQLLFLVEKTNKGSYLIMGRGNGDVQKIYNFTSASFLIKSVEAATIFYSINILKLKSQLTDNIKAILEEEESKKLYDNSYKKLAISIGEYFLLAEKSPGIFKDSKSLKDNIWGGYLGVGENNNYKYLINSRANGEALLAYLELANNCESVQAKRYFKLIDNITQFYIKNQLPDGNFGRWWTEDGTPVDSNGTNGAHILLFFIEYYKITKRLDLLESIERAHKYYREMVYNFDFFGDTLDADSCDKEAGIILLKVYLGLYELDEFHSDLNLGLCKICASFVATWIQLDNIKFSSNTPLGKLKFKTKGLTSVSIANQHLDLYGMMVSYEFLRLNKYIKDDIYKSLAIDMIKSSKQLISTPNNLLDRDRNFLGWIPEQINHTNWDYFNNINKAPGYYSINISWVHVLVLKYFMKIENEFPEVL